MLHLTVASVALCLPSVLEKKPLPNRYLYRKRVLTSTCLTHLRLPTKQGRGFDATQRAMDKSTARAEQKFSHGYARIFTDRARRNPWRSVKICGEKTLRMGRRRVKHLATDTHGSSRIKRAGIRGDQ